MASKTQILWTPAGQTLPSLGSRSLVDVSDGDTPNIRMPVRMLSIDTPEVTARSENGAAKVDEKFLQLAEWINDGTVPVSRTFKDYILPKLQSGNAGTLQYQQGKQASEHYKNIIQTRLTRPTSSRKRNLFVRGAEPPFDSYGRLLAYVAPSYSSRERQQMTRRERATFNFDMVESGWAAPFVLFPNIPGELDLPMFIEAAESAMVAGRGQYEDELFLPGYEYRMCEKMYNIAKKVDGGETLSYPEMLAWRSRYCADMRDRKLYSPEAYTEISMPYRLWIWPDDVQKAISMLNLVPTG